jgi:AbrB family looped-hinge helix DNA binding protein
MTGKSEGTMHARLDHRGRITVPKDLRRKLRLKPGDRLEFVEVDGRVLVRAPSRFDEWRGYLRMPGVRSDDLLEDMRGR